MKSRLILRITSCLLSAIPLTTFASSGWTDYAALSELIPSSHQRYVVTLATAKNPSDCKKKQSYYQDYDASGAQQMFNTLLQAIATGNQVRVYVTGKCELNGYSEISSVGILP